MVLWWLPVDLPNILANTDHFKAWLVSIKRSFQGLSIAIETVRIAEELVEIWPNEVCDIWQNPSGLETVNKFTERMRTAIKEVKSTIYKAQDNMKRYYDWQRTPALVFKPGDKVFLDTSDIWTTCSLQKLSYWWLGLFIVERRIRPMAYHLRLPHWMKQFHLVFNVVKLTPAPDDPITGQKIEDHPLPIVINGEAEWEVEEILDSRWHQWRF